LSRAQPRNDLNFTALPASFGSKPYDIAADISAKNQSGHNVTLYPGFGTPRQLLYYLFFAARWM